jgi:hypothetical protein
MHTSRQSHTLAFRDSRTPDSHSLKAWAWSASVHYQFQLTANANMSTFVRDHLHFPFLNPKRIALKIADLHRSFTNQEALELVVRPRDIIFDNALVVQDPSSPPGLPSIRHGFFH